MFELLIGIIILLSTIPVIFLIVELLFALRVVPSKVADSHVEIVDVMVLIPAHNEASCIRSTLVALLPELADTKQILVVADNCTDETAEIAKQCGVRVVERSEKSKIGKGYALEYGLEYLKNQVSVPDIVLFVDADCILQQGSLSKLAKLCAASKRPVQSLNLMQNKDGAEKSRKIAEFAWLVKNWVRPLGLKQLGLPCQLMGTGMAFPFDLLRQLKLGTSNIVEDMKLGVDCARLGRPPLFCPEALVTSYFPEDVKGVKTQTIRWEHGHLEMIVRESFGLLKSAIFSKDWNMLAMAMDLMVPPLTLLALVQLFAFFITSSAVLLSLASASWIIVLVTVFAGLLLALLLAWHRFARDIISSKDLLWIPLYVIAKIPIYVLFWTRRQVSWVRTSRK